MFMYRRASLKSRAELSIVEDRTREVFKAPTQKVVDGVLIFAIGVPSQRYHWNVAKPLADVQRSDVTYISRSPVVML